MADTSRCLPSQDLGGSLYLFDRKALRYFRKDGHRWRKKKDGKTVKEAHEKLKVVIVKIKGLKTGMYYLRSCAAADAIKFTVDTTILKEKPEVAEDDVGTQKAQMVCSLTNREDCMSCGS